jgi:hypothetical protein
MRHYYVEYYVLQSFAPLMKHLRVENDSVILMLVLQIQTWITSKIERVQAGVICKHVARNIHCYSVHIDRIIVLCVIVANIIVYHVDFLQIADVFFINVFHLLYLETTSNNMKRGKVSIICKHAIVNERI